MCLVDCDLMLLLEFTCRYGHGECRFDAKSPRKAQPLIRRLNGEYSFRYCPMIKAYTSNIQSD